tara:strand:+ start:26 stop:628 length:603 start_codon:yes stop_codon:yes gene_type:complete
MAVTISGSSGIASVDASAGSPSIRGSDSNSGIFYTADAIKFSTGGTQRAVIDNNGLSSTGHIIQVKMAVLGSALNDNNTSWSDIGLSETITLASTSNKLLISASISPYLDGGNEQRYGMRILVTPSGGSSGTAIQNDYWAYRTDDDWKATADHHQALYSPSSTAELTVKAEYIRYGGNSDNVQVFTDTSVNTLLLQEVAG